MNIRKYMPQSLKNLYHKFQSLWGNILYGFPASTLKVIAVTGTDGKTTTATLIYEMLKHAGYEVGLITSVSAKIGNKEFDTGFHVTTPDPWIIPKYLRMMLDSGIKWVVLEVTSHAIDQNRIAHIGLEKAVFTNITSEHLDYHKTWRGLAETKTRLISYLKEGGEVVYKSDEMGAKLIHRKVKDCRTVLLETTCSNELARKKSVTREGIRFKYMIKQKDYDIFLPILGEYNISNAQCAIKAVEGLVSGKKLVEALSEFKGIPGRMEIVRQKRPCTIIVDFAHTSNALKNALITTAKIKEKGRVIVVFGTAGLRDRYKRPKMGLYAAKYADIVIITAEDPRTERLEKINDSILKGALKKYGFLQKRFANRKAFKKTNIENLRRYTAETIQKEYTPVFVFDEENVKSREDAIDLAVSLAKSDDIVILTGKGHEKSLCFGNTEYAWSDQEAVKRIVKGVRTDKT